MFPTETKRELLNLDPVLIPVCTGFAWLFTLPYGKPNVFSLLGK